MGISVKAKLFYGVCLNADQDDDDGWRDDNGDTGDRVSLLGLLQATYPEFDGYSDGIEAIPGAPDALEIIITGHGDGLCDWLVLKSSVRQCCPSEDVAFDGLVRQDDTPFREFFELVGIIYEQPQWHLGCLYF